jgi:cytoskeletal protein CcmA (bactofilin family)
MAITLRRNKGLPLTFSELDTNFDELNTGKLNKAGDTMTGPLVLSGAPTQNLHAATKLYVDSQLSTPSGTVLLTGSTMTGPLVLSGAPTADLQAATKLYVDGSISGKVDKSGSTMTGALGLIAGSNTAPSLFFTGDIQTGIFNGSAGEVSLVSAGTKSAATNNGVFGIFQHSTAYTSDLNIGASRTVAGTSSINLIGDLTYTTFGLQLQRASTVNGNSTITHRGTGELALRVQDAGSLKFYIGNTSFINIGPDGTVTSDNLTIRPNATVSTQGGALLLAGTVARTGFYLDENNDVFRVRNDGIVYFSVDKSGNITGKNGLIIKPFSAWTTITGNAVAVDGGKYLADTTSAAYTLTLPTSPTVGMAIKVGDYAGTFATNNLTLARNGSNIMGLAQDMTLDINNFSGEFTYVDSTRGWQLV